MSFSSAPDRARRAGGQNELGAVGVDIAGQPVDAVTIGHPAHLVGQPRQHPAHLVHTALRGDGVESDQAQKGHGRLTVLAGQAGPDHLDLGGRYESGQVRVSSRLGRVHHPARDGPVSDFRGRPARPEQPPLRTRRSPPGGRDGSGRCFTHEDLPGRRRRLAPNGGGRTRAGHDQVLMPVAIDQVQPDLARMDPYRHAEAHLRSRVSDQRPADALPHGRRRQAGPLRVGRAGEEDQQGVATELEHVATVRFARFDHAVEAVVDQLVELLGAGPA